MANSITLSARPGPRGYSLFFSILGHIQTTLKEVQWKLIMTNFFNVWTRPEINVCRAFIRCESRSRRVTNVWFKSPTVSTWDHLPPFNFGDLQAVYSATIHFVVSVTEKVFFLGLKCFTKQADFVVIYGLNQRKTLCISKKKTLVHLKKSHTHLFLEEISKTIIS